MGMGFEHWLLVIVVFLLLFGSNKIPQLMRGLGAGVKEFKKGMNEGMPEGQDQEQKKDDPGAASKPGGSGAAQGHN